MFGFTCTVFFKVLNISGLNELVGFFLSQKIRFLSFVMKEEMEEEVREEKEKRKKKK